MPRPASASPPRRSACRCGSSPTAGSTRPARRGAASRSTPSCGSRRRPPASPTTTRSPRAASRSPASDSALRRAERAILRATDLDGEPFEIEAEGWLARIFQHEYDHLDGTLYVDRLGERDQRIVAKISRKLGWGKPGVSWMPGVDHLED